MRKAQRGILEYNKSDVRKRSNHCEDQNKPNSLSSTATSPTKLLNKKKLLYRRE